MSEWYLLQTKPKSEHLALQHLQNQGYEAYLPEVDVERVRRGKLTCAKEPMFSRYLFVRLNSDLHARSWTPIRSTKGVSQMVRFGLHYASVPESLVEWFQNVSTPMVIRHYVAGDVLEILDGPFQGLSAIFNRYDGLERAVVFLDLLAKRSQATFALSSLRLVK